MKKISENRFNAYVCFTKDPRSAFIYDEVSWYENSQQTLLGVILFDRIDGNFSAGIHKRNDLNQFVFEDCMTAFDNIKDAKKWLSEKILLLEKISDSPKVNKLFIPLYDDTKLHLYFKYLNNEIQYSAAKELLSEIVPHFYDVDGNFVEQFQTTGFNSRLWEIFLMCYFNEEGLDINRKYSAPDFLLTNFEQEIALEAVTISKKGQIIPFDDLSKQTEEYINEQNENDVPLMYGNSLYTKTTHTNEQGLHYWEYEHTKNKPFVIAIADFHEEFSMSWTMEALVSYLYGEKHLPQYDKDGKLLIEYKKINSFKKKNGEDIAAGFFLDPTNENISAVLHATSGTLAKFNRIGKQCGFGKNNIIMIKSFLYNNPDPNSSKPLYHTYNFD